MKVCLYKYGYGDGSVTKGDLSSDVIGFGYDTASSLEGVFGCGHENTGLFARTETGILGLGASPLSLVSQLRNKIGHIFSHCFVPITSNYAGKLIFGSQSTQPKAGAFTTQIKFSPPSSYYYLTLQSISVYDVKVSPKSDIDILIESGTTVTRLEENFYKAVETAVINSTKLHPMANPPNPFKLCYKDATLDDVPDITFHFAGDGLLLLGHNMFNMIGDTLCWYVLPSSKQSILGNFAQTNIKVEYDLLRNTVSFNPADCAVE
ncbi:hypothetical protein VNO77_27824 [Canavalia gladiata]|uniref:Peptidase A1 domain-containing protein n=1 Tax=Canavalia gladiata TaxID=3824 RepID=A0AAN9Q6V1_CANGL